MTVKQLIDKLQVFADNLEDGLDTPVLNVEYAFVMGGVQVHISNLDPNSITCQKDLDKQDLIFVEPGITHGIVLGFIPQYEIKDNKETEIESTSDIQQ